MVIHNNSLLQEQGCVDKDGLQTKHFDEFYNKHKHRMYQNVFTNPANFTLLHLFMLITHGEEYKSSNCSTWSILQPSETFCLIGPNTVFSTLLSNTPPVVLKGLTSYSGVRHVIVVIGASLKVSNQECAIFLSCA